MDQNLVSGDVVAKIAVYDEKIKTAKENIDANRKALKQLDESVDQVMGRSTDEKGADKAVALRRSQGKERTRLVAEIEAEQKTVSRLNEEAAPIRAEVRKVEAEVGPIKYIAAMIYGDNLDSTLLEHAVRWVIILENRCSSSRMGAPSGCLESSMRSSSETGLKLRCRPLVP